MKTDVSYFASKNDFLKLIIKLSLFKALRIKYRTQNTVVHVTIFCHICIGWVIEKVIYWVIYWENTSIYLTFVCDCLLAPAEVGVLPSRYS